MAKRIVFFSFLVAASAWAHTAPSVWEQMQSGHANLSRGIVKSVDISGAEIYFEVEVKDAFGDKTSIRQRLCRPSDGYEDQRDSEEVRAALLKSRIDLLQAALRLAKPIEFGTQGPWKPCVASLRAFES